MFGYILKSGLNVCTVPAQVSSDVGTICLAGKIIPLSPAPRISIVYE